MFSFDIEPIMNFFGSSYSFGSVLNLLLHEFPSRPLFFAIFPSFTTKTSRRKVEEIDTFSFQF